MTWKEYELAAHPERRNTNPNSPSGVCGCPPDAVDGRQLQLCAKGCKACWSREAPSDPADYMRRLIAAISSGAPWFCVPEEVEQ